MSAGTATVASSYFGPNGTAYRAISQSGGTLTVSSSWFGLCCGNSANNSIDITGTANFSVSDSYFPISAIPITYIYQAGTGSVHVVSNTFTPNTGSPSSVPVISAASGPVGPLIVADNILTNSDSSGYFVVTTTPAGSSFALVHDWLEGGHGQRHQPTPARQLLRPALPRCFRLPCAKPTAQSFPSRPSLAAYQQECRRSESEIHAISSAIWVQRSA